ncbi:MAG: hypothetical protein ACYCZF_16215, partial [Anaerolineae bacterium]
MHRVFVTVITIFMALVLCFTLQPSVRAAQSAFPSSPSNTTKRSVPLQPVVLTITSLDSNSPPVTRFIKGTRSVSPTFDRAVNLVLDGFSSILPDLPYFAITDVRQQGSLSFVSVIGLDNLAPDLNWTLDKGVWFGLVLLVETGNDRWLGALQGTRAFTVLLDSIPESEMSAEVKVGLDPLQRSDTPTNYIFPWERGTSMQYVSGVHQNGFASILPRWLAVDFISDGDARAGHAPNKVLAAAAGAIDYKCSPGAGETTAAIKVGDLMYIHLIDDDTLYQGRLLEQGELIGALQSGRFNENCGIAMQPTGQFHLHLGFLKRSDFTIEGWTLNLVDHRWYRDGQVRNVRSWFVAGEGSTVQTTSEEQLAGVAGGGQET